MKLLHTGQHKEDLTLAKSGSPMQGNNHLNRLASSVDRLDSFTFFLGLV